MAVDIKICGLTRPEDAAFAVSLGVDRLGVVFAWGRRVVDRGVAKEIVAAADDVPVIGVVSGGSPNEWIDLADDVGLKGVQLHGESQAEVGRSLQAAGLEVWRVATLDDIDRVAEHLRSTEQGSDLVLIEPASAGRSGGLGVRLDPGLARRAVEIGSAARIGLAGGLDPENVAEAIEAIGPDLVDVSSGVEISPGIKDPDRLARFVEAARGTDIPS